MLTSSGLSKRLDPVASRWLSCLQAMAATASRVQEADKPTLGQNLTLTAPHVVETLLRSDSGKCMSNDHILQYQSLLLDQPHLTFSSTRCLNPATLLPDPDVTMPVHDCQEVLEITETGWPDLQDVPLEKANATVFMDGSSFLEQGVQRAGAAITTETDILGPKPCKLDKHINNYTDSQYAFATVHVHGAIYQERGLLTSAGKTIKNKEEILALLKSVWLPQQVAVIHCKGHQKENTAVAWGNQKADFAAREAATLPVTPLTLLPAISFPHPDLPNLPTNSSKEKKQALDLQANA
ncbi:Gag-Pol polyprotein [Plecturocebus cupreus]